MYNRRRETGVALISVLLIVAILLAVVGRLMANHGLSISQNQNVFEQNQALQYALGAESLARQALFEDFSQGGPDVDHLGEVWAQPVLPFELDEGGFLEAQVRDLNGCFNLNNLAGGGSKAAIERLKRLLTNLNAPQQIADAWLDWIDGDSNVTEFGAEDSEYLVANIPHRTPNDLVSNVSEMALLQNMDADTLLEVRPHVCVLPTTDTTLNVNTANLQTLASLDNSVSPATAEAVVGIAREYSAVSDFLTEYPDYQPAAAVLSVKSEYFEMHAFAQVGDSSVTLLSVFHRDPTSGEVTVLARDFGRLFRSSIEVATEEAS
ncbi:MAG: general secretion pathway protein GspK [Pseudomonadales bacterium]|nr:general secretion pathway protein GspK [Pseudomonadales bacterium]